MITQTINGNEILLVTVPEDAVSVKLSRQFGKYWSIDYGFNQTSEYDSGCFSLLYKDFGGKAKYPQSLELIGKAIDLTEQQWQSAFTQTPYSNYGCVNLLDEDYKGLWVATAAESGLSLLSSRNLDPKTTLVIVKK